MKLQKLFLAVLIAISTAVFSQQNSGSDQKSQPSSAQLGQSILETEKKLDEKIFELNQRLTRHTVLMKMKVRVLPFRTVLFKGKANNDECAPAINQEDPANNCIRVEVYDFIRDEERGLNKNVQGALAKYMEIYFEGQNSNDPEPRTEPPRNINKLKSKIYKNNMVLEDKIISEVMDRGPNTQPSHNDKVEVFFQKDNYPEYGRPETPAEKGVGKYILAGVENTKTHPIRNSFKKEFYIKHLDQFDRLFTKIFDYNDQLGNENYKENVDALKDSLRY
ncbi:flagellar-coiling protein FcpB [Leptospira kirschneri]|uniref:Uncharacterized protein n=1 Tax=Leptospira kirschneri serovar Bulgarica str. Nikolaevo TaxID=1240687 RepID=M6EZ91_9LEPT|nr:hypothetical protein [Leptospira kirschneri]EMK21410.1 hypothetical protein LEP1GSC008_4408 [Leptospira kirschneri serovar Bulgarica str. Nikolaevo]